MLRLIAPPKEDILLKSQDVRNKRRTRFNHQTIRLNRKESDISDEIGGVEKPARQASTIGYQLD